jgi:hypothetical protein
MGNQLFQICAGIYLEKHGRQVLFEVSNLLVHQSSRINNYTRVLEVDELINSKQVSRKKVHWLIDILIVKIKQKVFSKMYVAELNPNDFSLARIRNHTREIYGFHQHQQLVEEVWPELKKLFEKSKKFSSLIYAGKVNRIAVHMRFGDNYSNPSSKNIYGLTLPQYYKEAITYILNQEKSLEEIIIVTDDLSLARSYLTDFEENHRISFISSPSPIEDLVELSRSSHIVISNSTFSWWAAWIGFNEHESKVIFPRPWLADNSDPDLTIYVNDWLAFKREFETWS